MNFHLSRTLGISALTAYSFALLAADPLTEDLALIRAERLERENTLNKIMFSFPDPHIDIIQIHHVIDRNNDGKIQAPEEIERIYADRSLKYHLIVKNPIPSQGMLVIYVPQEKYWGTTIDLRTSESSLEKTISAKTYTNCVDLTTSNATNSYRGKPQSVAVLTIEQRKRSYEQVHNKLLTEKRMYNFIILGKNGSMHSCMFTVDYGAASLQTTNTTSVFGSGK